jgi:enediyne polyketide synthase
MWRELLGAQRWLLAEWLADESGEDCSTTATRVWAVSESLKKAGLPVDAPLALGARVEDRWVLFHTGRYTAATLIVRVRGVEASLALAVLFENAKEMQVERQPAHEAARL